MCRSLEKINIPKNIKIFYEDAFYGSNKILP